MHGTHIYFRNFGGKGNLVRLGTIPSVRPFPATVIALHTCYTLVSITLSLLLLGNTFPRSRVFEGHADLSWPVLPRKGLLPLGLLPLATNATLGGASDFRRFSSVYVLASSLKITNYATQSSQLFGHKLTSVKLELHPL